MNFFPPPPDSEIRAAVGLGEDAVIALFHRWSAQLSSPPPHPDGPREEAPSQDRGAAKPVEARWTAIHQGDIYWVEVEEAGEIPGILHPYVVIQADVINQSRLSSVVVCALTSNLKRAQLPGNVLLEAGEAHLPKPSVVEVSKVSAVEKTRLGEFIGSLSDERVRQILAGMLFLQSISS